MPTIVDMRPSANTFRHATLIVIWLVVCLVGLGGCKSNLVKETCIDKPVWTTVVAKDCYTETVNQQTHTVYELTLIADGRDNQFKLRVDKPTYDRAFINNKPNRLSFNLNRSDYGTGWEPLIVALYFIMLVGGLAYRKHWNNTIDLSCEDFFKMKQFVQTGSKLQAVKHVKESAKCGLKEAKDFVDTYCDYVL